MKDVEDNFMLNEEEPEDHEFIKLEENTILNVDELTHIDNDNVQSKSSSKYGRITQLPNSDESDKLFDVHSQPEVNFKGKISQPLEV
uniref:Uncharacterized protein n=1 Tax=Strongyloides venezuelensis TaxID=75913 RepID=A0A0K0F282_STRVS